MKYLGGLIRAIVKKYNKHELKVYFILAMACITIIGVNLVSVIYGTVPTTHGLLLHLVTTVSIFVIIRGSFQVIESRHQANLVKLYQNAYEDHCENFKDAIENFDKYKHSLNDITQKLTEHKEILPEEEAMLSELSSKGVIASTINSFVEFSRGTKHNDTLFLIKVDHDKSTWTLKVSGRSIDLRQALYVINGIKEKIIDFSEHDSLIKKAEKILN